MNSNLARTIIYLITSFSALSVAVSADAQCSNGSMEQKLAEIINTRGTSDTLVLAHRGFWGRYAFGGVIPENSLGSLRNADKYCMDGVEVDVKISQDGVPYLMHDFNLGRTTDVYKIVRSGKFDPYTGAGANTSMNLTLAQYVDQLFLLTADRQNVTSFTVPRITDVLLDIKRSRSWSTPIVFDIKTSDALAAVNERTGAAFPFGESRRKFAAKVNATLFPYPDQYTSVAPTIAPIPVYTTNMLEKINVDDSLAQWRRVAGTIEINVKQSFGLLSSQMNYVRQNGGKVAVFHALPDSGRDGLFFQNTGLCCYSLKDIFFTWVKDGKVLGKDTADNRGSLAFLADTGYGLITTDDPILTVRYLTQRGLRRNHKQDYVKY